MLLKEPIPEISEVKLLSESMADPEAIVVIIRPFPKGMQTFN